MVPVTEISNRLSHQVKIRLKYDSESGILETLGDYSG